MFIRKVATPADVASVLLELLDDELAEVCGELNNHTLDVLGKESVRLLAKRADHVDGDFCQKTGGPQ